MHSQKKFHGRKAGVLLAVMLASCIAVVSVASAQNNRQGYLGVTTQTITDELREGLDFNYDGDGVLINNVSDSSPADRAGLRTGDVITAINNEAISSSAELRRVIRGFRDGTLVTVKIVRDGAARSFSVRLAGTDDADVPDEFEWRMAPTPPTPPAAPRAPRAPAAPQEPRTYWYHEDDDDGHIRESLKGLERLKDLKGLEEFHGLEGLGGPGGDFTFRTLGRGRLGVQIEDLDSDMAGALGVPAGRGALVRSVVDDTPARRAGIKGGDVITRINDQTIENSEDLVRTVRGLNQGTARVTVIRRGATQTLSVEVPERSEPRVMRMQAPRDQAFRMRELAERDRDRVRVRERLRDESRDDASLQREIEDLRRELEQLRRELGRRDDR